MGTYISPNMYLLRTLRGLRGLTGTVLIKVPSKYVLCADVGARTQRPTVVGLRA